ncbi:unnamed protein product, partial [Menidia menidia]
VTRDLLMLAPSFSLVPVVCVASARSLPARSTRWILLSVSRGNSALNQFTWVKLMVKMACERLLKSFMPVLAVVRLAFPRTIRSSISLWLCTTCL